MWKRRKINRNHTLATILWTAEFAFLRHFQKLKLSIVACCLIWIWCILTYTSWKFPSVQIYFHGDTMWYKMYSVFKSHKDLLTYYEYFTDFSIGTVKHQHLCSIELIGWIMMNTLSTHFFISSLISLLFSWTSMWVKLHQGYCQWYLTANVLWTYCGQEESVCLAIWL